MQRGSKNSTTTTTTTTRSAFKSSTTTNTKKRQISSQDRNGSGDVDEHLRDVDEDSNGMNDKKGDHDDDDGQEDHDDDENNAVKSFLDKITAEDTKRNNWNYGDHKEEEQEDREETMKEIESLPLDDAHDNDAAKLGVVAPVVDLFAERFSRPPLPETQQALDKEISRVQETRTLHAAELQVRPGMEVKVSSHWLKRRNMSESTTTENRRSLWWNQQAKSAFACNRQFLKDQWKRRQRHERRKESDPSPSPLLDSRYQTVAYPLLASYTDVLFAASEHAERKRYPTNVGDSSLSQLITLHILNHIWTSRSRIHKHNKRIQGNDEGEEEDDSSSDIFRDQGFTRPTVLVLLPTRGICFDFMRGMQALLGGEDGVNIAHWDRFREEFGSPSESEKGTDQDQEDEQQRQEQQRLRRQEVLDQKGPEWLELFGDDVNDDDDFRLGLAINVQAPRKKKREGHERTDEDEEEKNGSAAALKLFTDFYKSDVIVASPLGLKMACTKKRSGNEDMDDENGDSEKGSIDADFLSSIEICVLLRSNVLLMQNWDHVNDILKLINGQPAQTQYTDFSRVRNYMLLPGQACHWRQLIVDGQEFYDPMIASTFKRHAQSIAGLAVFRQRTTANQASIARVVANVRQVFQRVSCSSLLNQGQDKLKYFGQHILPELRQRKHSLIYIPSYFDFVAVRNLLLQREVDFVSVTEYARTSEVSRGRARFVQGRQPIMLYTGRAHFFYRHAIRGVHNLLFYGIPEHAQFYVDHVNDIGFSSQQVNNKHNRNTMEEDSGFEDTMSCLVLFTKYDSHALERIVGHDNCKRMVNSEKLTFVFDA